MSHAGNIKGGSGPFVGPSPGRSSEGGAPGRSPEGGIPGHADRPGAGAGGAREEKTRIGRFPAEAGSPGAGGMPEERTRIGRAPTEAETPRPGGSREAKPTGIWKFTEDGLENRGEARSGRTREDRSAGRFEGPPGQERPRTTGERPRLRTRTQEGAERGPRFDNPASPRTGERPRLPERRPVEIPRQGAESVPVPVHTPEGAEASGDAKPLEDLLPEFPEPIGMESLAHHFGEELRFLGAELRPSRLPPSERTARLWAFFLAYAQANAKDPAGQSAAGRERFREVLTHNGFSALYDVNTGRDGVEVALELLKARSPQELNEKLASVHIEPRPETLPSEVSIPVEQHTAPPEAGRPSPQAKKGGPFEPAAERPVQQPRQDAARFDQKEQLPALALQTNAAPQGVVMPPAPGLKTQTDLEMSPNPEDVLPGRERQGTNKRLGPHMLWNALHGFRDSPEDTAVKREQWSQLAFGAIITLVGAALLMAMLASL